MSPFCRVSSLDGQAELHRGTHKTMWVADAYWLWLRPWNRRDAGSIPNPVGKMWAGEVVAHCSPMPTSTAEVPLSKAPNPSLLPERQPCSGSLHRVNVCFTSLCVSLIHGCDKWRDQIPCMREHTWPKNWFTTKDTDDAQREPWHTEADTVLDPSIYDLKLCFVLWLFYFCYFQTPLHKMAVSCILSCRFKCFKSYADGFNKKLLMFCLLIV